MKTRNKEILAIMLSGLAFVGSDMGVSEAVASYPAGYYDSFEGKCGVELMLAVKSRAENHKSISYGSDTWNAFKSTDVRIVDGKEYWWDMYSDLLLPVSAGRPDPNTMNIEHSVANSWWGKTKNDAYKDIVHLNPSESKANSRKSNYPLAELGSVSWTNGWTSIGSPKSGQGGGASMCYEPADEYKGDFARVFMYMFTVYNDIAWKSNTSWMYDTSSELMFKSWARTLLLRWNSEDPVSDKERMRNDGIEKEQQNRNPFIDLPDLAEHIWGSKSNVPFSLSGTPGPGPGDTPDPDLDRYDWLASDAVSMDADWTIENVSIPEGGTYVWSWKEYKGNHYLNGSAHISGTAHAAEAYAWSPVVSFANVKEAKVRFMHAAKFQTTLRTLCTLVVKDADSGEITPITIGVWPETGNWNFAGSGDIDLSSFKDRNVMIGFRYRSTDEGADTWEINDMSLDLVRTGTGVGTIAEDEDDSYLVEVWGNNIYAPEGSRIFDLNGREFDGRDLQKGVYIVVKPTFGKSVKVMIN